MKSNHIAYFGGDPLGAPVLEILIQRGIVPSLVICNPDRPSGRGRQLAPPPVKELALQHGVAVLQPERIKKPEDVPEISNSAWDLFVVVAYNKILPEWLIGLPTHQTINLHPSLLPTLRGPSPIRTAILKDLKDQVGVSIMLMDSEMDHGPILAQEAYEIPDQEWPLPGRELDRRLAKRGGELLADTIPKWLAGEITPREQDHQVATYTSKLTKEIGELDIDPENLPRAETARQALSKIRAFDGWPGTYFFYDGKRIKITNAELVPARDELRILSVIPEGKAEISWTQFSK